MVGGLIVATLLVTAVVVVIVGLLVVYRRKKFLLNNGFDNANYESKLTLVGISNIFFRLVVHAWLLEISGGFAPHNAKHFCAGWSLVVQTNDTIHFQKPWTTIQPENTVHAYILRLLLVFLQSTFGMEGMAQTIQEWDLVYTARWSIPHCTHWYSYTVIPKETTPFLAQSELIFVSKQLRHPDVREL